MKSFNPKMVVISRFNLLTALFTHGLLTACNHAGTYHVREDQVSTEEASSTTIEHRLESEKESMEARELDLLYNQIYDSKSNYYKQKDTIDHLINFKAAAENRNMSFHSALKACSIRTGKVLSSCHLYDDIEKGHFELIAQVIYAGVVDTNRRLHGSDSRAELNWRCREVRGNKNISIVTDALSFMDKIKQLAGQENANDDEALWRRYQGYNSLKYIIKNRPKSATCHVNAEIDTVIDDILHKLIKNADTVEKRISLARYMRPEDVASYRHAFEIIDDNHLDGTEVLFPAVYAILSKNGYPIAQSDEDVSRIRTYLQSYCLQQFNRYQPEIPLFHDEASKDDMLLNEAYMKVYYARTFVTAFEALKALRTLAIDKKLNFQEVLTTCKENTGLMLHIDHLSHSLYSGNCDLVSTAISAGVVDEKVTSFCLGAPDNKENLRACAARHLEMAKRIGEKKYEIALQRIIEQLDQMY